MAANTFFVTVFVAALKMFFCLFVFVIFLSFQREKTGSCAINATWWGQRGHTTAAAVATVSVAWTITVPGKTLTSNNEVNTLLQAFVWSTAVFKKSSVSIYYSCVMCMWKHK